MSERVEWTIDVPPRLSLLYSSLEQIFTIKMKNLEYVADLSGDVTSNAFGKDVCVVGK